MKVSMKIEGGAALAQALNALPLRLSKRVKRDALREAGEPIRKAMSQLAPRAPGAPDLADHMVIGNARVEGLIDNDMTAAIAIGPERGLFFYGLMQEFGTVHHGAQPFARPAFDTGVDTALKIIVDELWWSLRRGGVL